MLNDKEKLIELLKKNLFDDYDFEDLAEELIANGVTIQAKGAWLNVGEGLWMCSECGMEIVIAEDCHPLHDINLLKCWHCGALLTKDPKDGE